MRLSTFTTRLLFAAATGCAHLASAQQAPTVQARTPRRNAGSVAPTTGVNLTFSEAISASTSPFVRIYGDRSRGKRTFTTSGAGTASLSYQPTQAFAPGELVQVSVPASMRSAATSLGARYDAFQFRVASQPAAATFTLPPDVPVGVLPVAVAIADLDGDGDMDFLASNRTDNSLSVRLNNGQGRFIPGQEINLATTAVPNPQPIGVQLADMDGDGDFDIVQVNTSYTGPSVNVFTNSGTANFTLYSSRTVSGVPGLLNVLDVTGDGSPDVVLQGSSSNAGGQLNAALIVLENNGYGSLSLGQQAQTNAYGSTNFIATGDFDNDGDLDALAASNNGNVALYTNQTTVNATGGTVYGLAYSANLGLLTAAAADIAVGDLDGDGDLDLVRTPTASGQVVNVHLNNGQGGFGSSSQTLTTGPSTDGMVLADMDGDGDLDLIASNYNDNSISIALNNGTGTLGTPRRISVGSYPTRPSVADLNGDGRLDILVPLSGSNTVLVMLNQAIVTSARPAQAGLIILYPNPAHDQLTLQLPAGTGPVAVRVSDALGRNVATLPATTAAADGTVRLPLPGLPAGIYQVQTTLANGASTTQGLAIE